MKRIIILTFIILHSSFFISYGQNLQSGYFTDGYLYRHDMNPAIGNEQNYVALPGLGNVNIDVHGTLGLKDILFNRNGKTTTFLNPEVSTDEFLKNIKDKNKLGETLRVQILDAGFKAFGGYNTVEINAREDLAVTVPGALLRAAKEGLTNETYDFSNLYASANAYAEIALGHSRDINDKLRLGVKVKALLGFGAAEMNMRQASLTLGRDSYIATVDADVDVNLKDVTFSHDINEKTKHKYVSGIDNSKIGLNGFGLAVDLGAEYKINDNIRVSAAVLDLGFLNYSKTYRASTDGVKTVNTDKYAFNVDDDATNNFSDEMDKLKDDLSALYELNDKGEQGSKSVGLGTTFNVGGEYTCAFYRGLSFGVLGTFRTGSYGWANGRLSANVAPVKIFSAGVNVAYGTYGAAFGWILNFHPTGFNLFVGMDKVLGSVSKQFIPLSSNASFSMGVNVPF